MLTVSLIGLVLCCLVEGTRSQFLTCYCTLSDMLLEAGLARKINDLCLLSTRIEELLENGGKKLQSMKRRGAELKLGKPDAANTVVKTALELSENFDYRLAKKRKRD